MSKSTLSKLSGLGLGAALGLGLATVASAQEPPPEPYMEEPAPETDAVSFDSLDRNMDGFLTRDEIPPGHPLESDFNEADTDGDGRLSREEFEAYMQR